MLNSNTLGQKIAAARKNANLSQALLAHQVSISPQAVGKWERGESMPDITTLHRLAEILGVDLNYFSDSFQSSYKVVESIASSDDQLEDRPAQKQKKKFNWNWNMSSGNWVDADFSGLKNLQEKFSSCNMKNCKFISADLSGLILASNNIEKCDFSNSDLRNSKIQSSNLSHNQFNHCSFIDTIFNKDNIENCSFAEADFSGVEFIGVNFGSNHIDLAKWKFTSFKNSALSKIFFEGIMEDCHFENCSFYGVTFQNATILNSFFKHNRRFKTVKFVDCKVDTITYAFLKNNQANLEGVSLIQ